MLRSIANVPTPNGSKYAQQLCKHWGHRNETHYEEGRGIVHFQSATVSFLAQKEILEITIEAEDREAISRYQSVVQSHLDRFAFKEAPLAYPWSQA